MRKIEVKLSRKSICMMVIIAAAATVLCAAVKLTHTAVLSEEGVLKRGDVGEGRSEYSLICRDDETGEESDRRVIVSERRCSADELDDYFDRACVTLEKQVLGANPEAENITSDLVLTDVIEGTPIVVEWVDLDRRFLYSDGSLKTEKITQSEVVVLTAKLTYYEEVRFYSFAVRLAPSADSEASFESGLSEALAQADKESIGTDEMRLPREVNGTKISWSEPRDNSCAVIAILGAIGAAAVPFAESAEKKKLAKKRANEMLRDYPDIISKFILLVTAGMTCRGAWAKICGDYKEKSTVSRPAYEEMQLTLDELELGKPEAAAYENFGRRCGIQAYQRFGTLLANNLKRGSKDILVLLELESKEAFAARKEQVQKRAEEAGTKLLGPMMGMLCIVIAIVVVPAFSAFS